MAKPIHQDDYDWSPVLDEERHTIGARAWIPESRSWLVIFFKDHMRRDEIVGVAVLQSYEDWHNTAPVDPHKPTSVTLDLANVTHLKQPVPARKTTHG
jgi:hypothetical protein